MKFSVGNLSPWVTLLIGYVLGYILYPVLQLWTCNCDGYRYEPAASSERLSKWMTAVDGRLHSSINNEKFVQEYLHPPARSGIRPKRVGTPRYLMGEYSVRRKLLIGVITAEKYLQTRAKAVFETWGQDVTQVLFFVGSDCNISQPGIEKLPIVKLPGIPDSVYPPQKKVFAMLKYMQDHYINDFKWFMRADDDVYIRGRRLEELLAQMDPNERVYLGRAGMGRAEDIRRLELKPYERYCMGGPGVTLSHAALRALAPHLDYCLGAVEHYNRHASQSWFNEDVELGRCVSRTINIQCSSSAEGRAYFMQDYDSDALKPSTLWSDPVFKEIITVHPVKQPQNLYSIHHFYQVMEFQKIQQKLTELQTNIAILCKKLPPNLIPPSQAVNTCKAKRLPQEVMATLPTSGLMFVPRTTIPKILNPKSMFEIPLWKHFSASHLEDVGDLVPQQGIPNSFRADVSHMVTLLENYINHNSNSSELNPVEVVDGYSRYSSELGQEYILDVSFVAADSDFHSKNTIHKRVRLIRPLGQEVLVIPEKSNPRATVNIIVPVHSVDDKFRTFMAAYERASLQEDEIVHLVLSVMGEGDNLYNVQSIIANYTKKYPNFRVMILAGKGNFSTVDALELGMSVLGEKELAFLANVSLQIHTGFFNACRRNTILGERIYFPIPFSSWNDPEQPPLISKWSGEWAVYDFQFACLYKHDYKLLGDDLETDLFGRTINSELEVIQAPEPRLTQTFSQETCDLISDQHKRAACLQARSAGSIDQVQLSKHVYEFNRQKHSSLTFDKHFRTL